MMTDSITECRKADAERYVVPLKYIADDNALAEFIAQAKRSQVLAVDTEFLREKTYYPKLCLIQLATDDAIAIVDPFAVGVLTPLASLLEDESVMKIFHAATQDIEILLRETGSTPWPLFDTQVAAALLGFSHQVGLAQLVGSICCVTIKIYDSFSDLSLRPLSTSQLEYASGDVAFLPELYVCMKDMLIDQGRLDWLEPDFRDLARQDRYLVDPQERFKHLKRANQLNRRQLAAARDVAAWRERRAQQVDIPRKWVLSDEQVVEACRKEARKIDDLYLIRGMREKLPTKDAREVAGLIDKALRLPVDQLPDLDRGSASEPNVDSALDMMLALTRVIAKEHGIAMQTLASNADLTQLARGHSEESKLLRGWRRQLIGEKLLSLLDGKLSLSLAGGELKVSRVTVEG